MPLEAFLEDIRKSQLIRLPGTAVYLTRRDQEAPPMLKRLVDELHAVHERGILLTVVTENVPRVRSADRIEILNLPDGFWRITLHYGFMQVPNIPVALRLCDYHGLSLDPDKAVFFQGYESVLLSGLCAGATLLAGTALLRHGPQCRPGDGHLQHSAGSADHDRAAGGRAARRLGQALSGGLEALSGRGSPRAGSRCADGCHRGPRD